MPPAKNENKSMTYEAARQALDKIIKDIQHENTSIDLLAEKIKSAQELIQYCQKKLRQIEKEVNDLTERDEEE
jgi:exodeoxyribonuclease VII small subunit